MDVKEYITHPKYDSIKMEYDYAIIRTAENIVFSQTANAACLPTFKNKTITDGKFMTISGWGVYENHNGYDSYATKLQTTNILGYSYEDCCNLNFGNSIATEHCNNASIAEFIVGDSILCAGTNIIT